LPGPNGLGGPSWTLWECSGGYVYLVYSFFKEALGFRYFALDLGCWEIPIENTQALYASVMRINDLCYCSPLA